MARPWLLPIIGALVLTAVSTSTGHASTPTVSYVQGAAFSASGNSGCPCVNLTQPVAAGDLLVAWVGEYNPTAQVSVVDPANGSWTRAPRSLTFSDGSGDIALFYVADSKAASTLPVTILGSGSGGSLATAFEGAVADYSGVATTNPLDQLVLTRGSGPTVTTGSTASVPAGELVYSAEISGAYVNSGPQPGTSGGVSYTPRATATYDSAYEQDILSSAAGPQQGSAHWPSGSAGTDWYAVVATFRSVGSPPPPPPAPSFVQGGATSTGSRVAATTMSFGQSVSAGDLLVGWFAQYDAGGQVSVSDPVNGTWTRGPGPADLEFSSGTGDIAMYYVTSRAAASGLAVTVSASSPTYLEGSVADYANVATVNPLDHFTYGNGQSLNATSNPIQSVAAGELVYGALVTGGGPQGVTPGASFTARAGTASGSAFEEDLVAAQTGAQGATATLGFPTDWYLMAATFRPAG